MEKMIKELAVMTDFFDSLKRLAIQLESLESLLEEKMTNSELSAKKDKLHRKTKRG